MLRVRCLVVALALLVAFASDSRGQSQKPTPPPSETAQAKEAAKPDQRGTEQSPIVVKVLPTKESEEKAASDARHEDEKTENDRRLARFTELLFRATGALSVIALFQLFVFGWQGIQLKRTVSAAKDTTELARQEFIASHRPKIKIHAVEITRRVIEGDDNNLIGASILCFNVRESVAKNVEVRGQIFMGPNFAIDVQRPIVKTFPEVLSGQKLRAEVKSDWQVVHAAASSRTGIHCHCIGWIAYWDENGLRRETGFCLRAEFSNEGDRWVSAGKPEYEYEC
jgi:hypothetical protein